MSPIPVANCRSCHARIIWTLSPAGANLPLDADPVDYGDLVQASSRAPVVYIVESTGKPAYAIRYDPENPKHVAERVHQSHFATCPNARQHSKRGER